MSHGQSLSRWVTLHEGYRVVGTTQAFFEHFSFGKQRNLTFAEASAFEGNFDAVWAQR